MARSAAAELVRGTIARWTRDAEPRGRSRSLVPRARASALSVEEGARVVAARPRSTSGPVPGCTGRVRSRARGDHRRVLVLARTERGCARGAAAARSCLLVPAAEDQVPSSERLGHERASGDRGTGSSLRRDRDPGDAGLERLPQTNLPAARHELGSSPPELRRREGRARGHDARAPTGDGDARQDPVVLLRRGERSGADRLLRGDGGSRGSARRARAHRKLVGADTRS